MTRAQRVRPPDWQPSPWPAPGQAPPHHRRGAWWRYTGWLWWWDGMVWTGHVRPESSMPGYFPDPADPSRYRQWSGHDWTASTITSDSSADIARLGHLPDGD